MKPELKDSEQPIIKIEKIVFVNLNENGKPTPHKKESIVYIFWNIPNV